MTLHQSDLHRAVLHANEAFYRAFSRGDVAAMRALWAERHEVTCIHPGAAILRGRSAVLGSWQQLLVGTMPRMRCDDPEVHLLGSTALVTCYEGNDAHPAHLVATNLFVLESDTWKMIHHQAGPLSKPRPSSERGPDRSLN